MSRFDDFIEAVTDGVKDIATDELSGLLQNAKSDTQDFLQRAEDKLRRRTKMLADGAIDKDDFADLAKGQAELIAAFALTQSGVAQARLERFRRELIDLVISSAFKVFLP